MDESDRNRIRDHCPKGQLTPLFNNLCPDILERFSRVFSHLGQTPRPYPILSAQNRFYRFSGIIKQTQIESPTGPILERIRSGGAFLEFRFAALASSYSWPGHSDLVVHEKDPSQWTGHGDSQHDHLNIQN
jgi:hypothetical protein